ncbi:RNA-directed DNA polymerase [Snodgrassella sp. ESL0324]|uniref:RNA-directed DNA polymerase n=1 Tax=Snodgrassella sp. ESL0324 TaxID=2705033 RepID=UPI001581B6F3|nr:RNA-directed DNA polymerase [Snodgrassella sp. ESL0324]NUF09672.1 RNA-directed DNA polymerase [Snodgrassella sp. ESL0324]
MASRKSLLDLQNDSAKKFFLKHESYCNIDLPIYFSFTELLQKLAEELNHRTLNELSDLKKIKNLDDVNYTLYTNKDGKLSWRPLQIIHPLVYVALVDKITEPQNWDKIKERFKEFQQNPKIRCLSIPVKAENKQRDKAQQISQWWEAVEQESIALSIDYDFIFETDIADCYSSIYTHSIAWAIETKEIAKKNRRRDLLGNFIDSSIQEAQYQQTNGIPQGSVLMDFIAEMVLGYVDELLTEKIKENNIDDYFILRYRDDYRIFVNSTNDGKIILKLLSEILRPFGLKLNSSKTKNHNNVVMASIKKDKLAWLQLPNPEINNLTLQKHILLIKYHSLEYPNSGSLTTALNKFQKRITKEQDKNLSQYSRQIISIVADIAYLNPKSISVCCAIISQFLVILNDEDQKNLAMKVYQKLERMSDSGFAQIWLQRMLKNKLPDIEFSEHLCQIALKNKQIQLWNHSWVNDKKILKILENELIFNQNIFDSLDDRINFTEFDIFAYPN